MGYGKITKAEAERRAKLAEQGIKVCSRCKRELPFSSFTIEVGNKDGYRGLCKECAAEQTVRRSQYYQKWREEHREENREKCREYYLAHREQRIEYNKKNAEKFAACRKINEHRVHNRRKLYMSNAERRGIKFELTLEEFDEITKQPCYYCGELPNDGYGSCFTGIDRIDSSKGYFVGNVVPCCNWCNKMKLDYTPLEWLTKIKQIYEHTYK